MADNRGTPLERMSRSNIPEMDTRDAAAEHGEAATAMLMSQASDEHASTDTRTSKKRRRRSKGFWTWWRESTAALLVAAAATASFATLYPFQGQPLPEWPYSITIGALLSAYLVVLRLASAFLLAEGLAQLKWRWFDKDGRALHDFVLHDDATRGPLGAISLLWRLPIPRTWQWLGCVLVLLSLLIGPFTQQVLQYYSCSWPADVESRMASVPRTSAFFGQGLHQAAGINTLTIAEQAAINAGLYAPGQVGIECQSGNCTIPQYTSLGYCAKCEDVSPHLQFQFVNVTNTRGASGGKINVTTYDPDGLSLSWLYEAGAPYPPSEFATAGSRPGGEAWLQVLIGLPNKPFNPATGGSPEGCDDEATNKTWRCQGFGAANCAFMPCTRTYHANVTNGYFQENVIDENTKFGMAQLLSSRYMAASIDAHCLASDELDFLRSAGITINDTTTWIPYDTMATNNSFSHMSHPDIESFENKTLSRGCLYALDVLFINGFRDYITSAFSGNLTGTRGTNTNAILTLTGSQLLQTVYNYGNFSLERTQDVFNNMSLSLTNYMRVNPGISLFNADPPALGEAFTTKTCVRVEWAWLALPAILAALTLAFFVGVIVSSGRLTRGVRTWKHSPLPLIFHGPHPNETTQHADDMNDVAKEIRVRLVKDEDGMVKLHQS